jgi:hypothetical protein
MRSIQRRFKQREKDNPCWSSWTCFADSIKEQDFTKDKIRRYFNVLVDKNDYEEEEKMQLLRYLYKLTRGKS